jgi:hypothetical protein
LVLLDVSKAVQEIIPVTIIEEYPLPFNSSYDDVLQRSRSLPATCSLVPQPLSIENRYYHSRLQIRVLAIKPLAWQAGREVLPDPCWPGTGRQGGQASMRAFLGKKENCLFS